MIPVTDLAACCTPVQAAPMDDAQAVQVASVLKAVADPTRLRLLSLLCAAESREAGEICVCDLTESLGLSQPTISHHLKVLLDVGLVQREKRGVWAYFRMVPGALNDMAAVLTGRSVTACQVGP